ncbi:hypothetical protein Moror_7567 [Moniliophthora roreri MCA 2997]|uniref:Uncharacterized protein n=1 Tax=Moniliophthora roreri (strain MCA 2997) TaxID=1381753 RepID=V2WQN5_MONRO|nr:hypothetical protein Moror_7567 [Moniliophthora roreri MCA 2997]
MPSLAGYKDMLTPFKSLNKDLKPFFANFLSDSPSRRLISVAILYSSSLRLASRAPCNPNFGIAGIAFFGANEPIGGNSPAGSDSPNWHIQQPRIIDDDMDGVLL